MSTKLILLRSLLAAARQRTADLELFEAVCQLARTEGATLAHQGLETLAGRRDLQAAEDEIVAASEGYVNGVVAELRRHGVGENEVAAYRAAAVIAMVETMPRVVAEFREAVRLPMQ